MSKVSGGNTGQLQTGQRLDKTIKHQFNVHLKLGQCSVSYIFVITSKLQNVIIVL